MSPDVLTAVFVGLGTLLTALTGLATTRARSRGITRREYRRLEKKFLLLLGHTFAVEADYTNATGKPARPRPPGIDEPDDDDDDKPTASRAVAASGDATS